MMTNLTFLVLDEEDLKHFLKI